MDSEYSNKDLALRKAILKDAENIYLWRNAPETSQYSFNTHSFTWEEHLEWFSHTLQRVDRCLLIGEIEQNPIGVLRFDINVEVAEISVYLVPGFYGQGLGTKLLHAGYKWLSQNIPTTKKIVAKILPENIPSQKSFIKTGFKEKYHVYEYIMPD